MKIFKNFRMTLMQEGKIKKYFLYAIGEILLVMIGISLAFQVDNWNEGRIKKTEESRFYQNIGGQIADAKLLLESQLEHNNRYMRQFQYANKIIGSNDRSKMDTLGQILINLYQNSDFDKKGNIYETMVNSGEIKLLRNDQIVDGIREIEERTNYVNRMENIHYDAVMKYVVSRLNPVLDYTNNEIKKPNDVYHYEFQNLIIILMSVMEEKNRAYRGAIGEIDKVTEYIEEELQAQE